MAKIDKQFSYLGLYDITRYNYKDKETNVNNNIGYMLNRSNIMFKYHGLPDTIPEKELEKLLQCNGFAIIGKINGDVYALNGGLGGVGDVYNRPTIATVSVPYLNYNDSWEIGKDCIIIYNDSNGMGLIPLFAKYCTLMNENEITMILATVNKRIQNLLSANDDNTIESAKQFIKNVFNGDLGVIAESKLFDSLKVNNSTNNNNVSMQELFEYEQYLKASMFNEIGLSANFNMKRERLTSAEIETNSDNLYPLVDDMLNNRRIAIEQINEMFNTDITVEFNSSWDYRVFNGESIHNVNEETDVTDLETGNEETDVTELETGNEESEVNENDNENNNELENDSADNDETENNPDNDNENEKETM